MGFMGSEVSPESSYIYADTILPIHGNHLGSGMVQRYWVDRWTYSYENDDDGMNTDEQEWSAVGALGYQLSLPWGELGAYIGLIYRNTRLSPDDSDSKVRDGKTRGMFQIEGEHTTGNASRISGNVSYTFGQENYWIRGRVLYNVSGLFIGPEAIIQEYQDYKTTQLGWVLVGLRGGSNVNIDLRIGAKYPQGESTTGYMGIELSRQFQ